MATRVEASPPSVAATTWSIDESRALYNVEGWGIGYFDINEQGHAVVRPDLSRPERKLDLFNLAMDLAEQGVGLPRAPPLQRHSPLAHRDALRGVRSRDKGVRATRGNTRSCTRSRSISSATSSRRSCSSARRTASGSSAAASRSCRRCSRSASRTNHMIVCNGYKDEEFMRLALMGQKLGHEVFIVIEQEGELDVLLRVADEMGVTPQAGVRIKLASEGHGRWAESGGEKSKFGLSASELVRVIDKLRDADRLDVLKLIHFHLGSQITDIRYIKSGLQEIARFYAELHTAGVDISHVDVGGGLGIDYDGSGSTVTASVNYSVQEYANDVVYTLAEMCRELEMPDAESHLGVGARAHRAPRAAPAQRDRRRVAAGRRAARDHRRRSRDSARPAGLVRVDLGTLRARGLSRRHVREGSRAGAVQQRRALASRARDGRAALHGHGEQGGRDGAARSRGVRGHHRGARGAARSTGTSATSASSSRSRTAGRSTRSSRSCPCTASTRSPSGAARFRT